jgi:hypothetical protein
MSVGGLGTCRYSFDIEGNSLGLAAVECLNSSASRNNRAVPTDPDNLMSCRPAIKVNSMSM